MLKSYFNLMVGHFVLFCISAPNFKKIWPGVRPLKRRTNSELGHKKAYFLRKVLILIKCPMGAVCKLGKRIK